MVVAERVLRVPVQVLPVDERNGTLDVELDERDGVRGSLLAARRRRVSRTVAQLQTRIESIRPRSDHGGLMRENISLLAEHPQVRGMDSVIGVHRPPAAPLLPPAVRRLPCRL